MYSRAVLKAAPEHGDISRPNPGCTPSSAPQYATRCYRSLVLVFQERLAEIAVAHAAARSPRRCRDAASRRKSGAERTVTSLKVRSRPSPYPDVERSVVLENPAPGLLATHMYILYGRPDGARGMRSALPDRAGPGVTPGVSARSPEIRTGASTPSTNRRC